MPFVLSSATTLLSSVLYLPSLCLSCLGSEGTLTRAQGSVSVSCVHVHCVHPFPFPCPLPLLIPSLSACCVSSQALLASLQSAIPSALVGGKKGSFPGGSLWTETVRHSENLCRRLDVSHFSLWFTDWPGLMCLCSRVYVHTYASMCLCSRFAVFSAGFSTASQPSLQYHCGVVEWRKSLRPLEIFDLRCMVTLHPPLHSLCNLFPSVLGLCTLGHSQPLFNELNSIFFFGIAYFRWLSSWECLLLIQKTWVQFLALTLGSS